MSAPALPMPGNKRMGAETGLAAAVLGMIALLILPLPPIVLDLFLAASIGISLIILLTVMQTEEALEFSAFPSILLLFTLFRLALNVSSTRLILSRGEAGSVIHAFGEFVIGGNYVVGVVLFLILIGINFIVITKGAGRVAEVSARFTLDAMPGKQMAIDADLSAGLIDEADARRRREEVAHQADFYGAMDGASKFVKGDAVAGLLITGINIVGGIIVGFAQRGMPFSRAAATYTTRTVGDGLVTQIPALIVSTATGIMVTRAAGGGRMGSQVARQLGAHPRAITFAAVVMAVFGLMPGMPHVPFLALALALGLLARASRAAIDRRVAAESAAQVSARKAAAEPVADPVQDLLQIDSVEIEVGYALIPLVDETQGGDLLERVQLLRKQSALEVGILVPPVRIRDDIRLQANEYVIKLRGTEIARAEIMPRLLLALDTGSVVQPIEGIETVDPSFGMKARWIPANRRVDAEAGGYVVVEASTVVATHLMEAVKSNAAELLGRQDVQAMLDSLKKTHGALVDDLIPTRLSLATLHRVLQRLLRERVPIRDLVSILEALGDAADQTKEVEPLTEHVRRSLMNSIARQYAIGGSIAGITLGASLEASLMGLFSPRSVAASNLPTLTPDSLGAALGHLSTLATANSTEGRLPPLIVPPSLRVGVRRLVEPVLPALPVLSLAELPPSLKLNALATWDLKNAN